MAAPRPGLGRPPRPAREWLRVATWREPALTVALPRRRRSRPAPQGALCAKPGAEEEAGPAAAGASPHKAASAPPSAAAAAASPPPPPKDAAKAAPLAPGPAASPPPPRPTEESVKVRPGISWRAEGEARGGETRQTDRPLRAASPPPRRAAEPSPHPRPPQKMAAPDGPGATEEDESARASPAVD